MSLLKVTWYVLRVKNMHPGSPSDPSRTAAAEVKPRSIYSILNCQSSRSPIRLLSGEAKPSYIYTIFKKLARLKKLFSKKTFAGLEHTINGFRIYFV